MMHIRKFTSEDVEEIVPVFMRGFSMQVSHDRFLHWLLKLQPDGFWIAEYEGVIAGMVGAVRYGEAAYVSMMVVEPMLQRRGIGNALMETLIADLERHGCTTIMLDATEEGLPLYRRFGFETFGATHDVRNKTVREVLATVAEPLPIGFDEIVALDAEAFGVPREKALALLLELPNSRAIQVDGGCVLANEFVIGPWIARTPAIAESLLDRALQWTSTKAGRLMVPSENETAVEMLLCRGFEIVKTSQHMRRGRQLPKRKWSLTYGQTSFALG